MNKTLFSASIGLLMTASWAAGAAYLTTPTTCDKLEKVESGQVWLQSPSCATSPGRVRIEIADDVAEVEVYVNGSHQGTQVLQRYDMAGVQGVLGDAEKVSESLAEIKPVEQDSREANAAKTSAQMFYSPENQARITAESERLKREVFASQMKEYYPEENKTQAMAGRLASDERVYVFISSSIPENTLREYIVLADKTREPSLTFVLRGLVGGAKDLSQTMTFIGDILKKDTSCDLKKEKCDAFQANVQVDPLLFARYQVNQVPTMVYARNVSPLEGFDKSEGLVDEFPVGDAFMVDGDASLDRLLEVINREAKSKTVDGLVMAMRKGFY